MPSAAALALIAAAVAGVADAQAPAQPPAQAPAQPPMPVAAPDNAWKPLDPANTLIIDTSQGRVVVEMHPELAPLHVARVKALARQGFYNGTDFQRVLAFMAQGGVRGKTQLQSTLPNLKGEFSFQTGAAIPYVSFGTPTEYQAGGPPTGDQGFIGAMPMVTDGTRGYALFCPGVASLAHGVEPNTANSQIFFMKVRGTNLEKTFTAWGRVVQGQEVIEALKQGQPPPPPADKMVRVRVMSDLPAAERPALQVMDTGSEAFKAIVQQAMKDKGPGFTLCDVKVPTR